MFLDHQGADWKQHKKFCKSVARAPWRTIPITKPSQDRMTGSLVYQPGYVGPYGSSATIEQYHMTDTTPPFNVHGSSPFILKMQMDNGFSNILLNDEDSSVRVRMWEHATPADIWSELKDKFGLHGSMGGHKLYVWAKRVSDWEFSVVLDIFPKSPEGW